MDDLERLLEQYSVADLNTLHATLAEGRHRRDDQASEDELTEASTYFRAGARRAPGACGG